MPVERAAIRMLTARIPALIQVREKEQFRVVTVVVLAQHVLLHFAESPRQLDVTPGSELLVAEKEYLIPQERAMNRFKPLITHVLGKVDAFNLRHEGLGQGMDIKRGIEFGRSRWHVFKYFD